MLKSIFTVAAICLIGSFSFAADTKVDAKTKETNKAHSMAPADPVVTNGPSGNLATGEAMQGKMSPEMLKWVTSMKACHKDGKNDTACHNRVIKGCEAKMTKEECGTIMSQLETQKPM